MPLSPHGSIIFTYVFFIITYRVTGTLLKHLKGLIVSTNGLLVFTYTLRSFMYAFIFFLQNEGMPDCEIRGAVEFYTFHVSVSSGIYTQRILSIFVENVVPTRLHSRISSHKGNYIWCC